MEDHMKTKALMAAILVAIVVAGAGCSNSAPLGPKGQSPGAVVGQDFGRAMEAAHNQRAQQANGQ